MEPTQQPNQSDQPQQPMQQPPVMPVVPSEPRSNGLKTTGGILSIVFGVITTLVGLVSLFQNIIFGVLALGLGIFWLTSGIRILAAPSVNAAKLLQQVAVSVIAYAGILLILGFFIPGFQLSAAILPIIFAVAFGIVSSRFNAALK